MTSINDLISNLASLKQNGVGGTTNESAKPEKTQFWINVGVEKNGKLVSLPMGIPMDKLEARKIPGSSSKNTEFRQLRQAEADLFQKIQAIMGQMQPGQVVKLPFTVELRRCEDNETVTEQESGTNPFAVGDIALK